MFVEKLYNVYIEAYFNFLTSLWILLPGAPTIAYTSQMGAQCHPNRWKG